MSDLDPAGLEAAAKALAEFRSAPDEVVSLDTDMEDVECVVRAYLSASLPPDAETREFDEDGRALCFQCGEPQSAHPDGEECTGREYARGFAAGRAAATPDPHNGCRAPHCFSEYGTPCGNCSVAEKPETDT